MFIFTRFLPALFFCLLLASVLPSAVAAGEKKSPLTAPTSPPPARFYLRNFEPKTKLEKGDSRRLDWITDEGEKLIPRKIDAAHGESLVFAVDFPQTSIVWRGTYQNPVRLAIVRRTPALVMRLLRYEIFIPETLPPATRVQSRLILKDKDGVWFEALGKRLEQSGSTHKWVPATSLRPGWNTLYVDLSESSTDLRARGQRLRWSRFLLSRVCCLGFSISADHAFKGEVAIDNLTVFTAQDRSVETAPDSLIPDCKTVFSEPLRVYDFFVDHQTLAQYGRCEFSLRVNRPILNPFRQKEIDITAVFTAPDGQHCTVPAFYYQNYKRRKGSDQKGLEYRDQYSPVGAGVFKIRFTPRQAGRYTYVINVAYASPIHKNPTTETFSSASRTLRVTARRRRGFVRVAKSDPHYFEFEDGTFFYPVGHSFRSPTDPRYFKRILRPSYGVRTPPRDRGLRAYEDLLPRMQKAGVNAFEVWMSSWWLGLEWTGKWRGYHGLRNYNLENAWKLDRLVELSTQYGQYIHLTIDNHGKAGQAPQSDNEFDARDGGSPYWYRNRADGGKLHHAMQLFSSAWARGLYKDKLRYIAARYGWSTHIYGFELWSELDLTGQRAGRHREDYASQVVRDWHREMATWLKSQDSGKHLITTHYSGNYTVIDRQMIRQPFINYITGDAYHRQNESLIAMLARTDTFAYPFGKPYQITEYGGFATNNTPEGITGDLYGGIWFSWLTRSAGAPLYWWFEHLARQNYFSAYTAFRKYIAGEDKRRPPGAPRLVPRYRLWKGGKINSASRRKNSASGKLTRETLLAAKRQKLTRLFLIRGQPIEVTGEKDAATRFSAAALGDGQIYYAYVYEHKKLHLLPRQKEKLPASENLILRLKTIKPGRYAVEFWNCWTGENTQAKIYAVGKDKILTLNLPRFVVQIALKIRRQPSEVGVAENL